MKLPNPYVINEKFVFKLSEKNSSKYVTAAVADFLSLPFQHVSPASIGVRVVKRLEMN